MTGDLLKVTQLVSDRARTHSQFCPHSLANRNPPSPFKGSGPPPLGKQNQTFQSREIDSKGLCG